MANYRQNSCRRLSKSQNRPRKGNTEAFDKLYNIVDKQLEAHFALLQEHIKEVRRVRIALENSYTRIKETEKTVLNKIEELTEVTKSAGESLASPTAKSICTRESKESIPKAILKR